MSQPPCAYIGCHAPAVYRVDYRSKSWPKPVLRCAEHGGHHEFQERWEEGEWVAIEPPEGKGCFAVHYGAKR